MEIEHKQVIGGVALRSIESLHALGKACDVDNEVVKYSNGPFASPDPESIKVTGLFQLLREPGV